MITVKDVFNLARVPEGDVGIEIEMEGDNLYHNIKGWHIDNDGSLREESAEYVLKKPLSIEEVKKYLMNLYDGLNNAGAELRPSVRTGVHVHINCGRISITQLYNFIVLYLTLENVLVHWCGEEREGNLFCLRASDAEYILHKLKSAVKEKMFRGMFGEDVRYASMNLAALEKYGSLEFRSMRAVTDPEPIIQWASTLLNLRQEAEKYENPVEIIESFSMDGPLAFCKRLIQELDSRWLPSDREMHTMIMESMRNAQFVAYSVDWSLLDKDTIEIGGLEFPGIMNEDQINEPLEDY